MNGNDSRFATGHRGESPSVSKQKHTETETNSKLPPGERWIMAVRHIAACQRNCETNKDLYNEKSVSQSPLTRAFASICQFVISEQKKFGGLFCVGPRPRSFIVSLLFSLAKRKSGWGICGSSGFCFLLLFFLWVIICHLVSMQLEPLSFWLRVLIRLSAYTNYRTEP